MKDMFRIVKGSAHATGGARSAICSGRRLA
jgi:hypothetical protein